MPINPGGKYSKVTALTLEGYRHAAFWWLVAKGILFIKSTVCPKTGNSNSTLFRTDTSEESQK
jgi:hypothetical protein